MAKKNADKVSISISGAKSTKIDLKVTKSGMNIIGFDFFLNSYNVHIHLFQYV